MKAKQISFQATQQQFCDWIRDPKLELPENFAINRMQVYRDLLFNNICSFINSVFPVTRAMLSEKQWLELLIEFFQRSHCQSPLYNDISLQFREYLSEQSHPILQKYPWLAELLQYEWLELYLDTAEIKNPILNDNTLWQLTTSVWVLVYQYPVYTWTVQMTTANAELSPSAIIVWRDDIDQICVEALSPLFAILIEQINRHVTTETDIYKLIKEIIPEAEIQIQVYELKTLLTRLKLIKVPHNN